MKQTSHMRENTYVPIRDREDKRKKTHIYRESFNGNWPPKRLFEESRRIMSETEWISEQAAREAARGFLAWQKLNPRWLSCDEMDDHSRLQLERYILAAIRKAKEQPLELEIKLDEIYDSSGTGAWKND